MTSEERESREGWGRVGGRGGERERERGKKCCIPAGSLGTNGRRFIKPHPALLSSYSLSMSKHSSVTSDT